MKKLVLILISTLTIFISACGNTNATKERETSTRVPNSVVGKWYDNDPDEGMRIWDFNDEGIYYFDNEKMYGKEDETYEIQRYKYSIEGDTIHLYKRDATIKYTSYGFCLIFESGYERKLYEYREDAVKLLSDEENGETDK